MPSACFMWLNLFWRGILIVRLSRLEPSSGVELVGESGVWGIARVVAVRSRSDAVMEIEDRMMDTAQTWGMRGPWTGK